MQKFFKKHLSSILLLALFCFGISLLLYPTVSNWWNSFHGMQAIFSYDQSIESMEKEDIEEMLAQARAYNEALVDNPGRFTPTDEEHETYTSLLQIEGTAIMGSLYIPSIQLNLPIYHGTEETELLVGIGHLEGSSLPIGGKGTHAVLSGHRGLPSARLLTDLDEVNIGDYFEITVLTETLVYEVDQIRVVLPDELDNLLIDPEQDYVTLVTCTPYGINTHRLLVRGHRVSDYTDINVSTEANVIDSRIIAPILSVPILVALIVALFVQTGKKKEKTDIRKQNVLFKLYLIKLLYNVSVLKVVGCFRTE